MNKYVSIGDMGLNGVKGLTTTPNYGCKNYANQHIDSK